MREWRVEAELEKEGAISEDGAAQVNHGSEEGLRERAGRKKNVQQEGAQALQSKVEDNTRAGMGDEKPTASNFAKQNLGNVSAQPNSNRQAEAPEVDGKSSEQFEALKTSKSTNLSGPAADGPISSKSEPTKQPAGKPVPAGKRGPETRSKPAAPPPTSRPVRSYKSPKAEDQLAKLMSQYAEGGLDRAQYQREKRLLLARINPEAVHPQQPTRPQMKPEGEDFRFTSRFTKIQVLAVLLVFCAIAVLIWGILWWMSPMPTPESLL